MGSVVRRATMAGVVTLALAQSAPAQHLLIPMDDADKQTVTDRLDETLTAIVRSAFITATAQGVLAGLA